MHFVGNDAWFAGLLLVHIAGAIMGIGPAFAFGILGPMAGTAGLPGALWLMRGMHKIETRLLEPVTLGTQWITGVLLIFNRGLDHDFFSGHRLWLTASIGLYIVLLVLGQTMYGPRGRRMIALMEANEIGPELMKLGEAAKKTGPIAPLLTVAIIVLMVLKPGSGCGPLLRC